MYHCSPVENRDSIARAGLDSNRVRGGLPGTYLWQTREHAIAYALPFDEIWEVDVTDLPVQSSRVRGEQWYPHPIERGRVRPARPLLKLAA